MNKSTLSAALGGIDGRYIEEALSAAPRGRQRPARRIAAIAIAAALCLALSVTALASAEGGMAYELLYSISPAAAQRLRPVNLSCEDNGIVMEVVSVGVSGGTAEAYIALHDLTGDRVDETTDLFDSYSINIPFDSTAHCEPVGFDADTRTALFHIEIGTMNGESIEGEKITFRVTEFLSAKREYEGELPADFLKDVGEAQETVSCGDLDVRGGSGSSGEVVSACLVPQERPIGYLPVERALVTGAGYIDGRLHIQLYFGDILGTDTHGYVWFTDAEGNRYLPEQTVSFWDDEQFGSYEEQIFDIAPEALSGLTLCGYFATSNRLTQGSWSVTFPLEDTIIE